MRTRPVSAPRTAVITGASRGLGLASAIELYRQGWRPTWVRREAFAQTGRLHGLGALRETGRNIYRRLRWQLFRR